jgi:hypothetical protein
MVSLEVTSTGMLVMPLGVLMLNDGVPDRTGMLFTSMLAQLYAAVGVTVMEATLTVDVYVVLPEENAGFRAPDVSVRFDRSALVASQGFDPPMLSMAREFLSN